MSRPGLLTRSGPIIPGAKPDAPRDLTPEELVEWERIVAGLSPERCRDIGFQILLPLLVTHVCFARHARDEAAALRRDPATARDKSKQRALRAALRAHGNESERIASLSTKLRLLPQNRFTSDASELRRSDSTPKPWQDWGNRRGGN